MVHVWDKEQNTVNNFCNKYQQFNGGEIRTKKFFFVIEEKLSLHLLYLIPVLY